ncbi:MAG TPA: T9SS type A sorting domain-containing protein [Ignavibacteria bacterium]|nr:T9SS type A sorting domain-containing protein [Ignavibacteria bacterium]HQY52475.1 T9SS type A sorting domain-containing protein [Ignavibacteria bacterium]HRB00392.1 T9SS type A sorting domain-containing protein [Ignavibacteria bacterium]
MKNFYILIFILMFFLSANVQSQVPERFSKPHDEVEQIFWNKKKNTLSFSDHIPNYNSVLFTNTNISRDSFPQNETSVKISKTDPNRVVAAWRDFRQGVSPANRRVGYSYSTDGGVTWSVSQLLDSTVFPDFPRNSDPVVAVDTAGNFYIAVITVGQNLALAIYKSTDGGVTFPISTIVANDGTEDKEWLETDFTPGSPYYNNLYISWTRFSGNSGIKLTRSTNSGSNWSNAVAIADPSSPGQGSDLAIGLDGEIYVTWVGGTATQDYIYFDKSTDGGLSFGTDRVIQQGLTPTIPITSSGVTFPSIDTDVSGGANNGNIYLVWCDGRNGDADIFLTRSTNKGANWSSPLRVNNDPVSNGKMQCWPWLAVSDSGNIAVIFYDTRNTSANNIVEAYLALSTDGGLSFTNTPLSDVPSPTIQPNSDIRFGDYIGIDYYGGKIVPVWTDERTGGFNMECYTAVVDGTVGVSHINNLVPDEFVLSQNYPNPFNPETKIAYSIPVKGHVSLKIYNSIGKEVASLVNRSQNSGNYEVRFDGASLNSGVYFYKIQVNDFVQTKKMILLK